MKQALTSSCPSHAGSQFQLAAGQLICVVQLAVHIWTVPFNTPAKNLLQFVGLSFSTLIAFTGLVLNYLNVSRDKARLAGQVFEVRRLTSRINAVKGALSVIIIGGVVVTAIIQAVKTGLKVYRNWGKITDTLASGARKVARTMSRIKNRCSAGPRIPPILDMELPGLPEEQPSSVGEPVPSLDRVGDIDRRERLARLSMNASEAAANTPGEGDRAGAVHQQQQGRQQQRCSQKLCTKNPLNMESKVADSGLEDAGGSLAALTKSERFARMRSFNNGKGGDEAVSATMRPRNGSTLL